MARSIRAEAGFAAARADYFGIWNISKPDLPHLLERLEPHKGEAQYCRGYLKFFRKNGRLSLEEVDRVIRDLAEDHWLVDQFPRSWANRD